VLKQKTEVSISKQPNLFEEIILYKLSAAPVAGRFFSYRRYISIFKKHIRAYLRQYGKPAIVHVHVPVKAGMLALWLKKKYGVPYVVTEHWAIYNVEAPDAFKKRNVFFKNAVKKILQHASMFFPVSKNLGEAVNSMVAHVPYTVVPNVADTTLFNNKAATERVDDTFVFLHVSTLNYQKNPQGILAAFKRFLTVHPNCKLVMVGGADDNLKSHAAALQIASQNIQFTGFIPYAGVANLMKNSDAFVLFSRYENSPCVITEALCCGLPVITADVGGINELVNKGNGVLIKAGDEDALLKAMIYAYENKNLFAGQVISKQAIGSFCYSTIGGQISNIYTAIVAGSKIYYPGK
jgi:glycosyltransferase involved in cell wall biosynthesis